VTRSLNSTAMMPALCCGRGEQVNYLSHALLTDLLLPLLKAAAPARVVHVASEAHHRGVNPPTPPDENVSAAGWSGLQGTEAAEQHRQQRRQMMWGSGGGVYADAKLMVVTGALHLARTVPEVSVFVADPGASLVPLVSARASAGGAAAAHGAGAVNGNEIAWYAWRATAFVWRALAPAVGNSLV
jgi:NAD(P)-dependent dehydrogenase (short-subunit alcohol dehydrogenase family)